VTDPVRSSTTIEARVIDLLRYANRRKVADALTAAGYDVSRATVNRWARGKEMPPIAARLIREMFGAQSEAAPEASGRLEVYLLALARKNGLSAEELSQAEADLTAAGVLGDDGGWPRLLGGGGAGGTT